MKDLTKEEMEPVGAEIVEMSSGDFIPKECLDPNNRGKYFIVEEECDSTCSWYAECYS